MASNTYDIYPMTWHEFRDMPASMRVIYIKMIREQFGVTDGMIASMLGTDNSTFSAMMIKLGINIGQSNRCKDKDVEGFLKWVETYGRHRTVTKPMSLEKAINLLTQEYDRAINQEFVRNPLAYALYRVWKIADKEK